MKDGEIAAFGPAEEIMHERLLKGIFETDIEILDCPRGSQAIY